MSCLPWVYRLGLGERGASVQQTTLPLDGYCLGPLFAPVRKQRPARVRPSGGKEVWAKWTAAEVPWTDRQAIRNVFRHSREMTLETGVQYSVDHVVPLRHPLVCGLHVQNNLCVVPLVENIRKSNNRWPDMWGEQKDLL